MRHHEFELPAPVMVEFTHECYTEDDNASEAGRPSGKIPFIALKP